MKPNLERTVGFLRVLFTLAVLIALVLGSRISDAATIWLTDSAGRQVAVPDKIGRVLPAGPPAAVVLYTLVPDRLIGWPHALDKLTASLLPARYASLPVVGRITGHGGMSSDAAILALHPDVIIDIGDVEPEYAELADKIQARTHIPYILLDGRLSHAAETYRLLGKLLDQPAEAEDLARYTEQILARWSRGSDDTRPRVYYARGADGLSTGADKSLTGEFLSYAGGLNVATGTQSQMKTTADQIAGWKPDFIVALSPAGYHEVTTGASWANLDAVKKGRVLLPPQAPFGWIDEPPAINRLLGIQWLVTRILPQDGILDPAKLTRNFAARFYHAQLSDAQLAAILAESH